MREGICVLDISNEVSPFDIKLAIRELAKKYRKEYFEPTNIMVTYKGESEEKPLHIGGVLFGMPNVWKGLYGQRFLDDSKVTIELDKFRTDEDLFNKCKELLMKAVEDYKNINKGDDNE